MTTDERLKRYEQIQERILSSLGGVVDILQAQQAILTEVVELLKQPSSSDLPDVLKLLIVRMETVSNQMVALPEAVARAVTTGEVP
jgi:hypothetical protein